MTKLTNREQEKLKWHLDMLHQVFVERRDRIQVKLSFVVTPQFIQSGGDFKEIEMMKLQELEEDLKKWTSYYRPMGRPYLRDLGGATTGYHQYCWIQEMERDT